MFQDARSITRRDAIKGLTGASVTLAALLVKPTIGAAQRTAYEVGYGLYGMRDLPYMGGLEHLARIGYKHVEITLRPGWNTEPKLLTRANRAEIRKRIGDLGLTLVDVMEGMQPASNATVEQNLERLRAAAEMAHECSPGAPALIQTPIGGRPGTWMQRRAKPWLRNSPGGRANSMSSMSPSVSSRTPSRRWGVPKSCSGCWTR